MLITAGSCRRTVLLLFLAALAGSARIGLADTVSLLDGRFRLGAELNAAIAPKDRGYFNYSDYETSSLRLFRADLIIEARLLRPLSLLADFRSDNLGHPHVYALYLRVTPWPDRAFDVQAGLVPPVFGAYPRRRYASENPLPSVPLAYQYLTDLRYDAVPATAEDLVAHRARGWRLSYPIGSQAAAPGVPLVNGERWDTGVELRVGRDGPFSFAALVAQGSPSRPRVEDDNDGKTLAGRLAYRPGPWLTAGISAATGRFLSREVEHALAPEVPRRGGQTALGADLEWARGYWIVRAETVFCRFGVPAVADTRIADPLFALGGYLEARYKIRPGLFAAARLERLTFSSLDSTAGRREWDAPVTRVEVGAGYSPERHVLLKTSWQHNRRAGGRVARNDLFIAQVALWF